MHSVIRRAAVAAGAAVVLLGSAVVAAGPAAAATNPACPAASSSTATSCTYAYTGGYQSFAVPAGVSSITVDAAGAEGGESPSGAFGGRGGRVQGMLTVTPGETLQVNVGGQGGNGSCFAGAAGGWNGGGYGGADSGCGGVMTLAAGGGGASDIRAGSYAMVDRLLVAGGGGGGGGNGLGTGPGGAGLATGGRGGGSSSDGTAGISIDGAGGGGGGLAAKQNSTGLGGLGGIGGHIGWYGGDGQLGTGGNGGGSNGIGGDGGGGGGGYYGGGAGGGGAYASVTNLGAGGGGGGGGSNYTGTATNVTVTDGYQFGDGQVTISWTGPDTEAPVTTIALTPSGPDGLNGWHITPVTAAVSAADSDDPVADVRCELDPATPPGSFADLPDSCSYTGPGASVSVDGQHVLYAAAVDANGNAGAVVSASFQIDATPPTLSASISPNPVGLNGTATASPNATDPAPGSGLASASCPTPPTSSAAVQTITCTATDNAGNTTTKQLSYVVQYALSGFQSPFPNTKWKVGSTVPVKIQLTDANGALIPDAMASSLAATCQVTFSATGVQPLTNACLKYNATTHQFSYNWKLAKAPTGTDTITVTVSYPGTSTTTTRSETIMITG